jgi:hypothetical protein
MATAPPTEAHGAAVDVREMHGGQVPGRGPRGHSHAGRALSLGILQITWRGLWGKIFAWENGGAARGCGRHDSSHGGIARPRPVTVPARGSGSELLRVPRLRAVQIRLRVQSGSDPGRAVL